jgi:hypothetical protein
MVQVVGGHRVPRAACGFGPPRKPGDRRAFGARDGVGKGGNRARDDIPQPFGGAAWHECKTGLARMRLCRWRGLFHDTAPVRYHHRSPYHELSS